jgi:hypothetical protein
MALRPHLEAHPDLLTQLDPVLLGACPPFNKANSYQEYSTSGTVQWNYQIILKYESFLANLTLAVRVSLLKCFTELMPFIKPKSPF